MKVVEEESYCHSNTSNEGQGHLVDLFQEQLCVHDSVFCNFIDTRMQLKQETY